MATRRKRIKKSSKKERILKVKEQPVIKLRKKGDRIELFVRFAYSLPTGVIMWLASLITIILTVLQAARILVWKEQHERLQEIMRKLWHYQIKMHAYITSLSDEKPRLLP